MFDSISNAVKSVTGRFSSPASSPVDMDPSAIDTATGKAQNAADTVRGKVRSWGIGFAYSIFLYSISSNSVTRVSYFDINCGTWTS